LPPIYGSCSRTGWRFSTRGPTGDPDSLGPPSETKGSGGRAASNSTRKGRNTSHIPLVGNPSTDVALRSKYIAAFGTACYMSELETFDCFYQKWQAACADAVKIGEVSGNAPYDKGYMCRRVAVRPEPGPHARAHGPGGRPEARWAHGVDARRGRNARSHPARAGGAVWRSAYAPEGRHHLARLARNPRAAKANMSQPLFSAALIPEDREWPSASLRAVRGNLFIIPPVQMRCRLPPLLVSMRTKKMSNAKALDSEPGEEPRVARRTRMANKRCNYPSSCFCPSSSPVSPPSSPVSRPRARLSCACACALRISALHRDTSS